jgi:hypothetical protein
LTVDVDTHTSLSIAKAVMAAGSASSRGCRLLEI